MRDRRESRAEERRFLLLLSRNAHSISPSRPSLSLPEDRFNYLISAAAAVVVSHAKGARDPESKADGDKGDAGRCELLPQVGAEPFSPSLSSVSLDASLLLSFLHPLTTGRHEGKKEAPETARERSAEHGG